MVNNNSEFFRNLGTSSSLGVYSSKELKRKLEHFSNVDITKLDKYFENSQQVVTAKVRLVNQIDKHNRNTEKYLKEHNWLHNLLFAPSTIKVNEVVLKRFDYLDELKGLKSISSIDERLSKIKKKRLDNLPAEYARLSDLYVNVLPGLSLEAKVIVLRALEIEAAVSEEFYVLYHAQTTQSAFMNTFLKEQAKIDNVPHKNRQFMRGDVTGISTNGDYKKGVFDVYAMHGRAFVDEKHAEGTLLSVSSSLLDSEYKESAAYFLDNNSNINADLNKFFSDYYHKRRNVLGFRRYEAPTIQTKAGGLHVIMIPKSTMSPNFDDRYLYLSQPYGNMVKDRYGRPLDNLPSRPYQDQYRIIYSGLHQDSGARMHYITELPKATRKKHKAMARKIAEDMNKPV